MVLETVEQLREANIFAYLADSISVYLPHFHGFVITVDLSKSFYGLCDIFSCCMTILAGMIN